MIDDQSGVAQQPQLPAHGEATQLEQVCERRRLGGPNGQRRDQPAAGRVGEKGDSCAVPMRHGAITMSRDTRLALIRAGAAGRGARMT